MSVTADLCCWYRYIHGKETIKEQELKAAAAVLDLVQFTRYY